MSYLVKKKKNEETYVSFVKKISFMGKNFVINKHIGKDSIMINKEKYILDNLSSISQEELDFRMKFLNNSSLSYNEELPKLIELKSINVNNLIEGKKCKALIDSEFAKEFIFNSNNIEGSKIPSDKVKEIIETGDTKYHNRNEVKEVKNSILAFEYLQRSFNFNISSIKRLYNILTKDLMMDGKIHYPKGFKKIANIVGNSQTTPPEKVEEDLKNLLIWYKNNKNKIHPLILAFDFHRKYEFIHPFQDGNGRTGRLIMNKILISSGYLPIIVYKDNKLAYFNALETAREGNHKKYYQFMLEQADKTYNFLLDTIKRY